jgi:hypothetical protein
MMKSFFYVAVMALVLSAAFQIPADAQSPVAPAAVTLPANGSFERGGQFTGTATINRFEIKDDHIVAFGFVTGVLSRGGRSLGSAVVGPVRWDVAVKAGGNMFASSSVRKSGMPMPISFSPGNEFSVRLLSVQAEPCQVVDVALGPVNLDVLGVQIALSPITLNLAAVTGTPLGGLVCSVEDLLVNIGGLVNVLNSILGLLTGLLGGLTGGLGGVVPPVP